MIFSSNLLYCLHFINFCSTSSINLQSNIIYSPTLGTSADYPDNPCRTPLPLPNPLQLINFANFGQIFSKLGKEVKNEQHSWNLEFEVV